MKIQSAPTPLRLGLIGCGRVAARGYVPATRRAAGVRLLAVADLDPARCAAAAPGVRAYPSTGALLEAGGVDGLVLATPAAAHLADARLAAAAGLPTLIEKPPALDAVETAALAALDPPPWIAFNRRFEPAIAGMRAALPRNGYLNLVFTIDYRRATWQPYVARYDALLDLGPHLIDLARWLLGEEPTEVRAIAIAERRAVIELRLPRATARIVCRSNRVYRERFEVRDQHGRLVARHGSGGILQGALARLRPGRDHPMVPTLAAELEAFACAARDPAASSPLATAADGLVAMTVIDAARRSAVEGGSRRAVAPAG